jgi:hypothetical protein
MPYIYTASPIAAKKIQAPAFTKRKIDGFTTGRLDQIHQVGLAIEKQIAYDAYITNLPAFLHATGIQSKVAIGQVWYPARLDFSKALPIALPPLCISSRKLMLICLNDRFFVCVQCILNVLQSMASCYSWCYGPDAGSLMSAWQHENTT